MIETLIAKLASLFPFGYAFGAGMVTTVSPCGIAMLPAYVSLYLGARDKNFWQHSPLWRGAKGLAIGLIVTLGFVLFFGAIGIVISVGGQFLIGFIPWVAVLIGVSLILLGIWLLVGGHLYSSLPGRLASRLISCKDFGMGNFFLFGIAYGIAALSCTLPVFLVVVGSALALEGLFSGLLQFVSYALGMGFILTALTLSSALFKETFSRWLRRLVPLVEKLSAALLIVAGAYILYFWVAVGDLLSWSY